MAVSKGMKKLKFSQELVSTVKDPIGSKDLVTRLQSLYTELAAASPNTLDVNTCDVIKTKILDRKLLKNANLAVQAYTACCLADILRLYAPDAPYNAPQLTEIFKFIISQLKHLNDAAFRDLYVQLLEKLVESKSIVLITDLPSSDKLIEALFVVCYDLSANGLSDQLEPLVSSMLSEVISESEDIPTKVLKLIMNKFLANAVTHMKNQTSLNIVASTVIPGFTFSLAICQSNVDRLSRHITKFVSDVVYESIKGKENEYGDSDDEDEDENGKRTNKFGSSGSSDSHDQLKKIHTLLVELWRYVPDILSSVMGLIDNELEADDESVRILATETVGKMISLHPNNADVQNETLINWRRKALDVSPVVRSTWAKSAVGIILDGVDSSQEITNGLTKSLLDSDERVRLVASKGLSSIPPDVFVKSVANETLMSTLGQLVREKHPEIRDEIIKVLGGLYSHSFDDLYKGDSKLDATIGWIPESILNLVYINDKAVNFAVDICLFEDIIPMENNPENRVVRMLSVVEHLSDRAKSSFFAVIKRQKQLSDTVQQLLMFIDMKEEGVSDKIEKTITWLAAAFPDRQVAANCLNQFIELKNRRFFRLLSMITSPDYDYDSFRNSTKELLTKLSDPKNIKIVGPSSVNVSAQNMVKTMKLLIYRAGFFLSNKSNVGVMTRIAKESQNSQKQSAQAFLKQLSSILPEVIQAHISEMSDFVSQFSASEIAKWEDRESLAPTLKIMYNATKNIKTSSLGSSVTALKEICANGTPHEAKYAVKILAKVRPIRELEHVLDTIWPLDTYEKTFPTHLSTISEVVLAYPDCIEDRASELTNLLIKEILLKNGKVGEEGESDENSWVSDEELENGNQPYLQAKLMALKVFVNRLRSLKDDEEKLKVVAEPVFRMLFTFVNNAGEIVSQKSPTWPTPVSYQVRLRLAAGLGLLKLAKTHRYGNMIKPQTLSALAYLIEDHNSHVTKAFLQKLRQYLNGNLIPEKFLTLVFFTAYEPDEASKKEMMTWVRATMNRRVSHNDTVFERTFVRLLHMVAHHNEFLDLLELAETPGDEQANHLLQGCALALEYIVYFLDLVASPNNCSLLYYLATRIKQYRDGLVDQEAYETETLTVHAKAIYMLSDLSQLVIREYSLNRSIVLQTWPGSYQLPADLFLPMKSTEEARSIASYSFLTDTIIKRLSATIKAKTSLHSSTKKRTEKRIMGPPAKVAKTTQTPVTRKSDPRPQELSKQVESPVPSAESILATSSPLKKTPDKEPKKRQAKPKASTKAKKTKSVAEPTRRSSRATKKVNYAGSGDESEDVSDEDDDEAEVEN
ncbi:unnamed protein product [Kuraishia capsulata CBS 1993]|uniref:Sister chromatid cohesion protein n=1 Tax=Kuraishia capsulata CBS 1993 TaxID=1382522 RepID=W6MU71_9ASCO|nr:uncharacterized protein KUCA_T00004907001 [Kuraishia capsulata CBS 1993]CDK28922.1 unnamed protein product [Kuraishia capsulata CBS 1993]